MSTQIQVQINKILDERRNRLAEVEAKKNFWNNLATQCGTLISCVQEAENLNPELRGITEQIRFVAHEARKVAEKFHRIVDRFGRQDICIGIGGAGRMGKSTFLQAVTGLGEEQIPTSDLFYTTAGRSLIVNSNEAIAVADMHTESSFINNVIVPMCKAAAIESPSSISEFKQMKFPEAETQAETDIINRLEDTQKYLEVILPELTGAKGRRISVSALRDYVAYPEDGKSKAGKFMAVANIVIYAPFPSSEVRQLRVVDLPGLGETGRNLAEVQTSGMSDVCDITLLMKRPDEKNVAWNLNDTTALDAMKTAAPLLDDQTKYTAILANVDGEESRRAEACVEDIKNTLLKKGRNFKIIRCDARNRDKVLQQTMPEVLTFLAENLPQIDNAIFEKATVSSDAARNGIKNTLSEVRKQLAELTRNLNGSSYTFKEELYNAILKSLSDYSASLNDAAAGIDEIWNNEVRRVTENVKTWITQGCGYGSMENLVSKISDEILAVKGQPAQTVNQLRIAFRKQWEIIDEHLQSRIAELLENFVDRIGKCTNSFIPEREKGIDRLTAVRKQLTAFAEKLLKTPDQDPGDDIALEELASPLLRLSEFDLRFRFHLEPTLIAATEVLVSNNLPRVNGKQDAASFAATVTKILNDKADEYSKTMCDSRASNSAFEKKKKLIENAVKDPAVCRELITMLQNSVSIAQSFNPNRIFAAIIDNAEDAFLRFKDKDQAFTAWVRGYESELRSNPKPADKAAIKACAELSSVAKLIKEGDK